jgi:hypothetical protein
LVRTRLRIYGGVNRRRIDEFNLIAHTSSENAVKGVRMSPRVDSRNARVRGSRRSTLRGPAIRSRN